MASIVTSSMEIATVSTGVRREGPKAKKPLKRTSFNSYDDGGRVGIRVGIRSSGKDFSDRVSELGLNSGVLWRFSAPVKQSQVDEEKQKYYVNTGYAIRALREEFPYLFYRELSFDMFRDDIVFKDPMNTFVGIENYKYIFWALRFHGRIFFRALWLDIVSVWQPVENTIMVRWTVHGIPRVPWESHARFDGTSEYKLDKDGKIYEHRVDNIAFNSPPKFRVLGVEALIESLGCPSTPKPTYFEFLPSSIMKSMQFLTNFTQVRRHLGL